MAASMELIIAGFGGQGILFLGEMLTRAAVLEGKHATWMPSYGPEQRGGTATCTVVISPEPIGSPVVADPDAVIALNRPSLDKFEPRLREGGVLVINASMVDRPAVRRDLTVVSIDAAAEARALERPQVANMVLLGALLAVRPVVAIETVARVLADHFPADRQHLVEINVAALTRGAAAAVRQRPGAAARA
ncbi:MAG: 2-oxoacid:acceptor oxidoreductase family protein [Armatimonadota bacterium]|nr:2-oxoacid:acceptor oxidoreductase family protein [Armatimonadota bacterium]MDR7451563.1 2-oxoacid:acceptor oxidoreductase family protein [Armatimonadota bacterium]MDR7467530.1 2-oxoacid:acceptor oxidoreductase family protein [Armatimonadota bacterium]MDR7494404.1 2-oxoacid:acceptor oxidoreductase family protein [Armatimonadota bacterium]MDR7499221.1 2-oxoacid:acceptor oxidoreductase family protein [Armatimonadota bacterium]